MRRYALTGAPGAGKTAIIRELARRGYPVIEEAATDIIAAEQALGDDEPWQGPGFVETIVAEQVRRERRPVPAGTRILFADRSPVCTLALARFLGAAVPDRLAEQVDRVVRDRVYDRRVFLVRPIGFVVPTAARRIGYADSLAFERVHELTYRRLGFRLVDVPPGPVAARADHVLARCRPPW
jgi:predicted ATPase